MKKLRDLIDKGSPVIFVGNWKSQHARGWRWVRNIDLKDESAALQIVKTSLKTHGKTNVAIGYAFDSESMEPAPIEKQCGLYIRDVEDIIEKARAEINSEKALEEWLAS